MKPNGVLTAFENTKECGLKHREPELESNRAK